MKSPVRLTMRGLGSALAAGVFVCTLVAVPAPASARQADHPVNVPEGDIKIHGHWVIEVRNPDGGLAERREFDNALTADGRISLASYLNRASTFAFWVVELSSITTRSAHLPWRRRCSSPIRPASCVHRSFPYRSRS